MSTKDKASPEAGNEDASIAGLVAEATNVSVKAVCTLIAVPLRISARCLNCVATTVEGVCEEIQAERGRDRKSTR
jgi:hypothetical protein